MDPDALLAVCCQGDDVLALFDLASGEARGTIPVGGHPVHACHAADRVFVATMDERSLAVIDLGGDVTELPLGTLGPSHFAAARGRLFVTCTAGDVVAMVDPDGCTLIDRIGVGAAPHELDVAGDLVFVGTRKRGTVDVVDPEEGNRVGSVDLGDDARVEGLASGPEGERVYAVNAAAEEVVALSATADPSILATAPIGPDAYDLLADDQVYVPSRSGGTVTVLDPDLAVRDRRTGYDRPVEVCPHADGHWVIERGRGHISTFDGRELTTPAGALTGTRTERGIVLSHYDDGLVSLVAPGEGVLWTSPSPANPFGTIVV